MKTNKQISFNALNSNFAGINSKTQEWELDMENLVETLRIEIEIAFVNDERYIHLFQSKRSKSHSVVWNAFSVVANRMITEMLYPNRQGYYASSEHLKSWLKSYGYDYKECFAELIQEIDEFRNEKIQAYRIFENERKKAERISA